MTCDTEYFSGIEIIIQLRPFPKLSLPLATAFQSTWTAAYGRGTDVFEALALGTKAVGIGRPFLWGLGAFGQAGVERVLETLQGELQLAMGS